MVSSEAMELMTKAMLSEHLETGKPCEITVILGSLWYAKLEEEPGVFISFRTDRSVYQCWQGPIPSGEVIFHRNGNNNDDSIGNLELIPIYK